MVSILDRLDKLEMELRELRDPLRFSEKKKRAAGSNESTLDFEVQQIKEEIGLK